MTSFDEALFVLRAGFRLHGRRPGLLIIAGSVSCLTLVIPVLSFLFPTFLGRIAFLIRWLAIEMFVPVGIATFVQRTGWNAERVMSAVALAVLILYGVVFVMLPRVRDCGMRGWTLLLNAIPVIDGFYGLVLIFGPSRPLGWLKCPDTEPEPATAPPSVAGNKCAVCGTSLVLASEGIVADNRVLCVDCHQSGGPEQDRSSQQHEPTP